tara:strand:+ start:722 stop:1804 length:1083 start_codon:yes stop_codon:yes gene_type:complete
MALENLKSAFSDISLNNAKRNIREKARNVSLKTAAEKTQDLLYLKPKNNTFFGAIANNNIVDDILNNANLDKLDYSTKATVGYPFKNQGDNPIPYVEVAVERALKANYFDIPNGKNSVVNAGIAKLNQTIDSLKVRALREVSELGQMPVIGKPSPFFDLSRGPGETNYLDFVSLQPASSTAVDDTIAPETKGDFYVKIKDLRDNKLLYFRGFVTGITENVSPSWSPTNYIGRSEPVYMYERAERDLSFNLRVYPANHLEFMVMYDKLEKLTSLAYPAYAFDESFDGQTRMKPPFTELYMAHIGTRKEGQFGFIKSISYTVPGEGDWDSRRTLPRLFDIAISYQILSKKPPSIKSSFYKGE